ncbi:unnamed protein product, partial [Allacma fusca]
ERYTSGTNPLQAAAGLWEIPVPIVTEDNLEFSNHTPTIWLSKDTSSINYAHNTSKWIVLNPDAFGYYRVLYDADLLKLIQYEIQKRDSKISGLSKSQLIDDYFSFAKLGHVPITTALDMTTFLQNETDFVVWFSLFNNLQRALQLFSNEDMTAFRKYLGPKIDSVLDAISWDQGYDKGTKVIFRTKLADWACALGSEGCVRTSMSLFEKWKSNDTGANPITLDMQPVIYCAIVANGGDAAFEFILEQFKQTRTTESQKEKLLKSLSCSKNTIHLLTLIDMALDPNSQVRKSIVSV